MFAGAKLNYNLPVVRNWLYLKMGIGLGVGIHDLDVNHGCIGLFEQVRSASNPDLRVKPHMMVDIYWLFRVSRHIELKFAPLLISPSQLFFGSAFGIEHGNKIYTSFNVGPLGLSVRF